MFLQRAMAAIPLAILLAACSVSAGAPEAVERYLRALAEKDVVSATSASCLKWEEAAFAEASSFEAVEVEVEGLKCLESASDGEFTQVDCEGKLIANYGGELQDIDLSLRTYLAVREGGEWKMCGYGSN